MAMIKNFEKTAKIPTDWIFSELKSVVDINPESHDPSQNSDEKFSYIDIDSVENGSGVITAVKEIFGKNAPSRARRIVRTDDVIMSEVRPYLKAFALIPKKLNNQICSTGFAVLRGKGEVDPKYLLNTLFSDAVIEQCNRMMVGAQYPALNDSQVKKIQILLPPLPEQRRIATILTTVDDAIQRSRQAIAETERLKVGVMHELMTKGIGHTEFREDTYIGRIPKEWDVKQLDEVCPIIVDCPHSTPVFRENGIPVIRTTNVRNGELILDPPSYVSESEYRERISRCEPSENDILFSREAPVGEACLVPPRTRLCLGQRMMLLRSDPLLVDAYFLVNILYQNEIRNKMFSLSGGATAKHLNVADVKLLKIPIPSLAEQKKIAAIIRGLAQKRSLQCQRTTHYEKLKQGLMNELLTGRRRVKI
jgi:type I restriction enzyme S subunit